MKKRFIAGLSAAAIIATALVVGSTKEVNAKEGSVKTQLVKEEQSYAKPKAKQTKVLYPSDKKFKEFMKIPLGVEAKSKHQGDFDGDGKTDKAVKLVSKDESYNYIQVTLGNGISFKTEKDYFSSFTFEMLSEDLNGDGNKEFIFLTDAGACGGDGMCRFMIYGKQGKSYKKINLPKTIITEDGVTGVKWNGKWNGKEFNIQAKGMSEKFVLSKKQMDTYYKGSDEKENKYWMEDWKKVKTGGGSYADGISALTVKKSSTGAKVIFRQYMRGPTGHHLDGIGYCVTEMTLDKNQKWAKVKNNFLFREKIS